jgi:hypothetical protein
MNDNRKVPILFFIFLSIFLLVSCNIVSKPSPSEEVIVTETADYTKEIAKYYVSVPVKTIVSLSNEKIVKYLFSLWMNHFKSQDINKRLQLNDFSIQEVQFPDDLQKCATNLGIELLAKIIYSYQTTIYPAPDWNSFRNGEVSKNNWVNNNMLILGVFIDNDQYSFRILSAPPCAGIAIDGNKISQ